MTAPPQVGARDALRIGRLDAHGQAALIRSGEVSAAELVEAAIRRVEILDPRINALSHRAFDLARIEPGRAQRPSDDRPMAGVPMLIKDSLRYPGLPAGAGSRSRGSEPSTEAYPFIQRFDDQGLIPLGMSNMAEFGLLISTEPLRHGPTCNPWRSTVSAGGSSGGAAAAVAAGLTPLAHGSDGAGSIRVPAAVCGLVGFKPSRGANLRARNAHWLDDMLCSDAMIARSVRDAAWAFAAARPTRQAPVLHPGERRLRIGLVMDGMNGEPPHADVADAVLKTAGLCRALGHTVEEAVRPAAAAGLLDSLLRVLWPFLGREAVDHCLDMPGGRPLDDLLEPWTIGLAEHCAKVTPAALEAAFAALSRAPTTTRAFFEDYDVMLSPVIAERTARIGELAPTRPFEELMQAFIRYAPYTPLQNAAGSPAISLPLFETPDGLPTGSMFAADRGGDDLLLALALELERALPWAERQPAVYTDAMREADAA